MFLQAMFDGCFGDSTARLASVLASEPDLKNVASCEPVLLAASIEQ
jgi:hypothetical protein